MIFVWPVLLLILTKVGPLMTSPKLMAAVLGLVPRVQRDTQDGVEGRGDVLRADGLGEVLVARGEPLELIPLLDLRREEDDRDLLRLDAARRIR